ncbi:hypothetical protein ACKVMT_06880 [Halobacteriales archaeon Cl-PHB]
MVADTDAPSNVHVGLVALGVLVLFPLILLLVVVPLFGSLGFWQGPGNSLSPTAGVAIAGFAILVLGGLGLLLYRTLSTAASRRQPTPDDLRYAHSQGDVTDEELEALTSHLDGSDDDS